MKLKSFIFIIVLIICFAFYGQAFSQDLSGTGNTLTDDTGGGPGLEDIDLSANVSITYNGAANEYELAGVNTQGNMEYGVWSGDSLVYMQNKDEDDNGEISVTDFDTTDGSTVGGWAPMGSTNSTGQ